nr:UDP-rhamnose/UDP-galactose transporter 2-like [Tanacetum cinerariifolium]
MGGRNELIQTPPCNEVDRISFAVTTLVRFISNSSGYTASKHVPLWELLRFSIVANMSITEIDLNLTLNSFGFYQ